MIPLHLERATSLLIYRNSIPTPLKGLASYQGAVSLTVRLSEPCLTSPNEAYVSWLAICDTSLMVSYGNKRSTSKFSSSLLWPRAS